MTLVEILLSVLIVAAIFLCIYLIISLRKLNDTVNSLSNDIHDLHEKISPVIANLNEITGRLAKAVQDAENSIQSIGDRVKSIKDKLSFKSIKGDGNPENPVNQLANKLAAISKGISAFWSNLRS